MSHLVTLLTNSGAVFNPNWFAITSASRVHIGGVPQASFGASTWSNGYTHLNKTGAYMLHQDGKLLRVVLKMNASAAGTGKVKVFRKNGSNYDFVGEESISIPSGTGPFTIDLVSGVACAMADSPAFYDSNNALQYSSAFTTAEYIGFTTGDITASDAFSSQVSRASFDIDCFGKPPFLSATGDSLCQGVNNNPAWDPAAQTGTITGEVWHELRGLIDATAGAGFQYQNLGTGGTWALGASTGAAACAATLSKAVIFHYGVNDINTGRVWADVAADMATCKAALAAGQDMWIDEILPDTNFDDTKAATVRTFNANYATWCAANGAHLIAMHDVMGQTRQSTGQLDDLKTAYNAGDNVHLSQAGVDAMAALYKTALESYYGYK